MDVGQAVTSISEFIRFVEIPVLVNGKLVSRQPIEQAVPELQTTWRWQGEQVPLGPRILANIALTGAATGEVRVDVSNVALDSKPIAGRLVLRQGVGSIRTFRNRFGLATASIPSEYQLGGVADFLVLQPTAGREALTTQSQEFLNTFAAPLDTLISERLAERPEANASQSFINWASAHQKWDLCGMLRARIEPGDLATLRELAANKSERPLLVYAGADPATMGLASTERPMVQLARNHQRRLCEHNYLSNHGQIEMLSDEPKILKRLMAKRAKLSARFARL